MEFEYSSVEKNGGQSNYDPNGYSSTSQQHTTQQQPSAPSSNMMTMLQPTPLSYAPVPSATTISGVTPLSYDPVSSHPTTGGVAPLSQATTITGVNSYPPTMQMSCFVPVSTQVDQNIPKQPVAPTGNNKLYSVKFGSDSVDIFPDDILEVIPKDAKLWGQYQRGLKRIHPCKEGCIAAEMCCVPPWILHMIAFAPFLWCGPTCYHLCCKPYRIEPMSNDAEDYVVLTKYGLHINSSTENPLGIRWRNINKVTIKHGKENDELHVKFGVGCLIPCYYWKLTDCTDMSRVYSVKITGSDLLSGITLWTLGVDSTVFREKVQSYRSLYRNQKDKVNV